MISASFFHWKWLLWLEYSSLSCTMIFHFNHFNSLLLFGIIWLEIIIDHQKRLTVDLQVLLINCLSATLSKICSNTWTKAYRWNADCPPVVRIVTLTVTVCVWSDSKIVCFVMLALFIVNVAKICQYFKLIIFLIIIIKTSAYKIWWYILSIPNFTKSIFEWLQGYFQGYGLRSVI